MADEPMTDERLAEIRQRMHEIDTYLRQSLIQPRMPGVPVDGVLYNSASDAVDAATALLAEVDRLRAREAVARVLVHDLINMAREPFVCTGCGAEWPLGQQHKSDCPITLGYAWLDAQKPHE